MFWKCVWFCVLCLHVCVETPVLAHRFRFVFAYLHMDNQGLCAFTGIFMHISSKNFTLRLWKWIWSVGTWLHRGKLRHWTQSFNSINHKFSGVGINLRAYFWAEQPLWGLLDLIRTHRCQCHVCPDTYWTAPLLQHSCHTPAGAAASCCVVVRERELTYIRSSFSESNDHTFFTVVNPLFTGSIFYGGTFKNVC